MSTKCQHYWNCAPLTPVTLCWHFPLTTDVSKRFIGRDCFTHIAAVGNNHFVHCDVTGRSRHVSTSMFFRCLILTFKQTRSISIKWICPSIPLTHLPLDKMAAISQTTFSNAFSWMKSFVFWLKFHWSLFRLRLRQGFIQHKITYESFTSGLHCKTIQTYWTNMNLA